MAPFSPLLIILLVRFIFIIVKAMDEGAQKKNYKPIKRRYKMNLRFRRKIKNVKTNTKDKHLSIKDSSAASLEDNRHLVHPARIRIRM